MNKRLNTIMSEYYQNLDIYQKLSLDVNDIINTLLEVHHIKISNMAIRIKSEEALRIKPCTKINMPIWMKSPTFSVSGLSPF